MDQFRIKRMNRLTLAFCSAVTLNISRRLLLGKRDEVAGRYLRDFRAQRGM